MLFINFPNIELAILVTCVLLLFFVSIYSSAFKNKHPKEKHFAVFVCGPDPHNENHEKNERGQHYITLLNKPHTPNGTITHWSQFVVYKSHFPTAAELETFDAVVLSGSKFDAHDENSPWMQRLRQIIRHVYNNQPNTKLLGICFGHQIIANSLKFGKSGRNPRGIHDFCIRDIRLNDQFFEVFSESLIPEQYQLLWKRRSIRVAKSHMDVVLLLPENAILLASSGVARAEMYSIDNRVLGMQGHPEFSDEYFAFVGNRPEDEIPAEYDLWQCILQKWLYH